MLKDISECQQQLKIGNTVLIRANMAAVHNINNCLNAGCNKCMWAWCGIITLKFRLCQQY